MEALVITLREGLEIALVLAVLTAYLAKTGRQALTRYVYAGAGLAAALSAAGALLVSRLGIEVENELVEGLLYLAAAALVGSMIVWMWRSGRQIARDIGKRLDGASRAQEHRLPFVMAALSFFLVAREGMEIVLFLAALAVAGVSGVPVLVGGIAGLAVAAGLGVLFVTGALRVDLHRFFSATSLVLAPLAATFAFRGVHELMEVGALPEIEALERLLEVATGPVATNAVLVLLVAVPLLLLAQSSITGLHDRRLTPKAK